MSKPQHIHETNRQLNREADDPQWLPCIQCGTPLLRDPETQATEPCPRCASRRRATPLVLGTVAIGVGLFLLIIVVAFAVWLIR